MKKSFSLIEIIIAVAVIALLGGGGLYWRETKKQMSFEKIGLEKEMEVLALKEKIEKKNKEALGETGSVDISNPALSGVEGWKTYRNEIVGFEFKYPFPAHVTGAYITTEEYLLQGPEFLTPSMAWDWGDCSVFSDVVVGKKYFSMEDFIKEEKASILGITTEKFAGIPKIATITTRFIDINGLKGTILELREDEQSLPYEEILIVPAGKENFVSLELNCNQVINNTILSTFEFVPSASSGQVK